MNDDDLARRRARQLKGLLEKVRANTAFDYSRLRIAALPRCRSSMAYFELGDPQGTPLLCLHGLSVSGYYFQPLHEHFASRGIRAVAPNLLGGVSLQEPERTVEDLADELIELMDVLGIPRCDLLGFSWGTLPQLALLARTPQRVRKTAFLGPMLPLRFLQPQELAQIKPDVRLSLRLVKSAPLLHRALMWSVCRLPVTVLMRQFVDEHLAGAERNALQSGSAFHQRFVDCIHECIRTTSGFFTSGWRMFLDEPDYTLADLSGVAEHVDVRFYVGEHDNVHLPAVAQRLAAACAADGVWLADRAHSNNLQAQERCAAAGVFHRTVASGGVSIWMTPGAGRMACMLYLKEALDHWICAPSRAAAGGSSRLASG